MESVLYLAGGVTLGAGYGLGKILVCFRMVTYCRPADADQRRGVSSGVATGDMLEVFSLFNVVEFVRFDSVGGFGVSSWSRRVTRGGCFVIGGRFPGLRYDSSPVQLIRAPVVFRYVKYLIGFDIFSKPGDQRPVKIEVIDGSPFGRFGEVVFSSVRASVVPSPVDRLFLAIGEDNRAMRADSSPLPERSEGIVRVAIGVEVSDREGGCLLIKRE